MPATKASPSSRGKSLSRETGKTTRSASRAQGRPISEKSYAAGEALVDRFGQPRQVGQALAGPLGGW